MRSRWIEAIFDVCQKATVIRSWGNLAALWVVRIGPFIPAHNH